MCLCAINTWVLGSDCKKLLDHEMSNLVFTCSTFASIYDSRFLDSYLVL